MERKQNETPTDTSTTSPFAPFALFRTGPHACFLHMADAILFRMTPPCASLSDPPSRLFQPCRFFSDSVRHDSAAGFLFPVSPLSTNPPCSSRAASPHLRGTRLPFVLSHVPLRCETRHSTCLCFPFCLSSVGNLPSLHSTLGSPFFCLPLYAFAALCSCSEVGSRLDTSRLFFLERFLQHPPFLFVFIEICV